LKTWALFGPPLGKTWQPTEQEKRDYPEVRPLVGNPWTVLTANPPAADLAKTTAADLHDPESRKLPAIVMKDEKKKDHKDEEAATDQPAWRGTLLPKSDADVWLATAFAAYQRIAARDKAACLRCEGKPDAAEREELAIALYGRRADYNLGARAHPEKALAQTKSDLRDNDWHRVASGKGVLLLHGLRGLIGDDFDGLMDRFGKAHAGKPTSVEEFRTFILENAAKKVKPEFFDAWTSQRGLPPVRLEVVGVTHSGGIHQIKFQLAGGDLWPAVPVDVTVETSGEEVTKTITPSATKEPSVIETKDAPRRLVVDKYNHAAKANGGVYSVITFAEEPEQTLIVYGTGEEANVNREAAEALQNGIRIRHSNVTVAVKSDKEVTDDDLKTHHVLLIGRPDNNAVVARFRDALPVTFGTRSITAGASSYGHPDSAVLAAAENPLDKRYSLVVVAGLSAAATLRAAPELAQYAQSAEAVVLPHGKDAKALVLPAKDLTKELAEAKAEKAGS
jgi:hypothetical protein